jgi:DNA-binding NtrC family response regulator
MYSVAPQMEQVYEQLRRVARAECTVLIGGESGTGKELAARAIHQESSRKQAPFRAVNCATLSPTLLESELFGHVRGAFTGALHDRPGLFSLADHGMLFLDEVANMTRSAQQKLLRVLEYQKIERVGGSQSNDVDDRIIAATNADLEALMEQGDFLRDLYDRLSFAVLTLPPLRRRREDIPDLIAFYVDHLHAEIPDLVP